MVGHSWSLVWLVLGLCCRSAVGPRAGPFYRCRLYTRLQRSRPHTALGLTASLGRVLSVPLHAFAGVCSKGSLMGDLVMEPLGISAAKMLPRCGCSIGKVHKSVNVMLRLKLASMWAVYHENGLCVLRP